MLQRKLHLNDEESLREAPGPSAGYQDSGKARVLLVQSGRAVLHLLGRVERRLSRRGCLSRVLKDKQGVTWNRGAEEGGQASHRTACQGPGGAERSPCLGFYVYFISLVGAHSFIPLWIPLVLGVLLAVWFLSDRGPSLVCP